MTKREEKRLETRGRLLRQARLLFLARAYDDVPLTDILDAAGLQKGGLYHHFTDKRALFRAVYVEVNAELTEALEAAARRGAAATAPGGGRWGAAHAAFDRFFDALDDPGFHRFFYRDGLAVLGWEDWLGINRAHSLAVVDRLVAELDRAGELRSAVPEMVPVLLAGASDYAADWALAQAGDRDRRKQALTRARMAVQELVELYRRGAASPD